MTMLLGVASGQERDIKAIQNDLSSVKERREHVETALDTLGQQVDAQFTAVNQRLDAIMALLTGNHTTPPGQ